MKRLFGSRTSKSLQSEKDSTEALEEQDATEETKTTEDPKPQKTRHRKQSIGQASIEDIGQGDIPGKGDGRRARSSRTKEKEPEEKEEGSRKVRTRKEKASTSKADFADSNEDEDDDKTVTEFIKAPPPRPLPRRVHGSTSLFPTSDSEEQEGYEESHRRDQSDDEVAEIKEVIQDTPATKSKKAVKGKETSKKPVAKKSQRAPRSSDDPDGATRFVSIKDSQSLPKIESAKGGHFFSSVYNYTQPISTFRFRARLLKYPSFTDQQQWSDGEMAVVDERVFQWQEKIFSKSEAKRFQKLDNCLSEQERKYHDELAHSKKSVGKYLHSYVNDDLYSIKKKMKLLTRRCPVPHTRNKEKNLSRLALDTSIRSMNSDDSLDLDAGAGGDENVYSDDSIDFDEPVSSSTPVQGRKGKVKGASEIAKAEKRVRERKEKEMKDLERRSLKLKEELKKREKDEEKKRQEEEAKVMDKIKKLEAIESKEKELKAAYMKKYKYSKRPSMPLGARIRSVRLTPSPGKLDRKKKSYTVSRSSEISEDFQDDEELGSGPVSLDSKDDPKKPDLKSSSKVGTEYEEYYGSRRKLSSMGVIVGTEVHGKLDDRASHLKNAQTMHIMASIPYLPGRIREVVVCSIQNVPNQQVLIFKPAMGYRNIETKRNNVFRISCEICPSDETVSPQQGLSHRKTKGYLDDDNIYGDLGFFENVPKNEFRLSVLGEIATAYGFDASPICIYYAVDIPKGWRNDSLQSNTEGMTHTCFTNHDGLAHFSHEFSFQLVFSMDFIDEPEPSRHFPTPVIALMAVSMNHPSPRIVYEGYGYVTVPMTPGCHFLKIRMWKPRPRTVVERMRATFLDISPSLQDMKLVYPTSSDNDDYCKANLIGLQTDPSGTVKLRLHVIHQSPSSNKEYESNLDLLEKMSSATILRSVQAVIQAFQRVRQKAETLKNQYD